MTELHKSVNKLPNGLYNEFEYLLIKRAEESKQLTTATLTKYRQQYNFLTKKFGIQGQNWILGSSQDDLINKLTTLDTGPQAKTNYNNIFIIIRQAHGYSVDKLQNFKSNNFQNIKATTQEKIILKQSLPSYVVIKKFINDLYKSKDYARFIVNWSVYEYGLRNKDINLRIVTDAQFNSMKDTDKVLNNFIIIHPSYIEYWIDDYKTRSSYGLKRWIETSKKINEAVRTHGVGYLLTNSYNERVDEANIGRYIKLYDLDNMKLTEGDYFKIRLLELGESKNPYKKLDEISQTRGSRTLSNLNSHYNINEN